MNFSQKVKTNIVLNLLAIPALLSSLFLTFFSVRSPETPEFYITISSVQFEFSLENSSPIQLFSPFSQVSNSCADSSSSPLFDELCPFVTGFSFGGFIYTLLTILATACIINTITGLWWVHKYKKPAKFDFTSFLAAILYFIGTCSYLLISSIYSPDILVAYGVGYCVLMEIYLCLLAFQYNFVLKKDFPLVNGLIQEIELRIEVKDTNISPIVVHSRAGNETYQSEEEYIAKGIRTKRQSSCQSIQVDGNVVDSTVSEHLTQDIHRLIEKKKYLEKTTGHLKDLLDSSAPDISIYQSKIELKSNEIKNLRELVNHLKEKLLDKDLAFSELERDLSVYKALADNLSANNSMLNKDLNDKDRMIESIRNSERFRSFEEVNEKDIRRENMSSHDRYTESTNIGFSIAPSERESIYERIQSLNKALEIQKEINDQLNDKNKKLEEIIKGKDEFFEENKDQQGISEIEGRNDRLRRKNTRLTQKNKAAKDITEAQLGKIKELQEEQEKVLIELGKTKDKAFNYENMYMDTSSQLTRLRNEWESEKEDLKYSKALLQRELDSFKSRLKLQEDSLNHEIQLLTAEIDRLKDQLQLFSTEYNLARNEIESLKDQNSVLIQEKYSDITPEHLQITPGKLSQFIQSDPKYDRTFTDLDKSFQSILSEKEDLRRFLIEKDSAIQELSEMNSKLNQQLFVLKDQPSRPSLSSRSEYTLGSLPSEGGSSWASGLSVQEMMIIESLGGVDYRTNPLLEKVSKLKKEPPMIYTNLWKLMEKLMVEKGKVDKIEYALKRKPRPMYDFVADFFISHFGLQTLANRQLKAMTTSLEELNRLNHPYGVFFSRLLGLYHPRPIPPDLCSFLMVVQAMFTQLSIDTKNQSFAQHYEILQYGGNASIVDVMELVMKVCNGNRKVGERVIYSMHKDSDKKLEICLLKACGTLAKTNSDPKSVFELLDNNESKNLDYHEFVDGLRYTLGIWISQEEAEDICAFIDEDSNGLVTVEEWARKVDFQVYLKKIYEPCSLVTKVQVLNAFIEEYELEMIEDYNKLRQSVKLRSLNKEQFVGFLKEIDSNWKEHEALKMFERLRKDENTNFVSAEGTCLSVMKNKVGGYGVGIFGLEKIIDIV